MPSQMEMFTSVSMSTALHKVSGSTDGKMEIPTLVFLKMERSKEKVFGRKLIRTAINMKVNTSTI